MNRNISDYPGDEYVLDPAAGDRIPSRHDLAVIDRPEAPTLTPEQAKRSVVAGVIARACPPGNFSPAGTADLTVTLTDGRTLTGRVRHTLDGVVLMDTNGDTLIDLMRDPIASWGDPQFDRCINVLLDTAEQV